MTKKLLRIYQPSKILINKILCKNKYETNIIKEIKKFDSLAYVCDT